jgi:hypothetical protein
MSDTQIDRDPGATHSVRPATVELGRLEARRALRAVPFWVGLAATGLYLLQVSGGPTWQSESYQMVGTVAFGPLCAGIFVAAVFSGSRDRAAELPLAEEAALDAPHRSAARLIGVLAHVAVVALIVATVAIATRVEGGFWIGDGDTRIDNAVHTLPELIQPILAAALAGAAGIAVGRSTRMRSATAIAGGVLWMLSSLVYWVWQSVPLRYVTVLQTQPVEVELPRGVLPTDMPGMQFSSPGEFQDAWRWVVVDAAMAAWHDVYLVALVLVCVGLAIRGRGGRVLGTVGALAAVGAVVAQVVVAPAMHLSG